MNIISGRAKISGKHIPDIHRSILGFIIGIVIIWFAMGIFQQNYFDFGNMKRGVEAIFQGINPWAEATRLEDFYNPPFSVIFLLPLLIIPQKVLFVFSAGLLFALIFYYRAWVGLAWFFTNSFLYIIAMGGVDMYVMGSGIILLLIGDKYQDYKLSVIVRVLAYGFLLVKPQGGMFIVALYILSRFDWAGVLTSMAVFVLPFIRLYPDWISVLLNDPPVSQTIATHSIAGKYGLIISILVALVVVFSRQWSFWQLGGVLAAILSPYGMPGVPLLLIMTAIQPGVKFILLIVFSGALAYITWVTPPDMIDFYFFVNHLMAVYHLLMIMASLYLACCWQGSGDSMEDIKLNLWFQNTLASINGKLGLNAKR